MISSFEAPGTKCLTGYGVSGQVLAINDHATLHPERTSDWSVVAWFRVLPGKRGVIFSNMTAAFEGVSVQVIGGKIELEMIKTVGASHMYADSTDTVDDGDWHHLGASYNGAANGQAWGAKFYIDGVQSATVAGANDDLTHSIVFSSTPEMLRRAQTSNNGPTDAAMQHFQFYDWELGGSDFAKLYDEGRHSDPRLFALSGAGPFLYYPFTTGDATDKGSGGNDGTVSGLGSRDPWRRMGPPKRTPALGPHYWDPFAYWESDKGVTVGTGVSDWEDQKASITLEQSTGANQPALVASDLVFLDAPSLDFSTDSLAADTGDISLLDQRFFHDDTTDWEILMPILVPTGASPGRSIIGTGAPDAATGFAVTYRSGGVLRCNLQNGTTRIARATTAAASVVFDTPQLLRLTYNSTTKILNITIDAISDTDTSTGVVDTGDAQGTLTMGALPTAASNADMKTCGLFISKTIAGADLISVQNRYYNEKYGTHA